MSSGSNWYDALPTPKSSAREMTTSDLKEILDTIPTSVIVVDVRRADIEPPLSLMLPRAMNLPAQTFYQTLPVTIDLLINFRVVVFHCSSSRGRGPRCAGWYEDALKERGLEYTNAYVLTGGIKAWVEQFPDQVVVV